MNLAMKLLGVSPLSVSFYSSNSIKSLVCRMVIQMEEKYLVSVSSSFFRTNAFTFLSTHAYKSNKDIYQRWQEEVQLSTCYKYWCAVFTFTGFSISLPTDDKVCKSHKYTNTVLSPQHKPKTTLHCFSYRWENNDEENIYRKGQRITRDHTNITHSLHLAICHSLQSPGWLTIKNTPDWLARQDYVQIEYSQRTKWTVGKRIREWKLKWNEETI